MEDTALCDLLLFYVGLPRQFGYIKHLWSKIGMQHNRTRVLCTGKIFLGTVCVVIVIEFLQKFKLFFVRASRDWYNK